MGDHARFFTVEEDETTEDAYDTTETTHYDGQASIHTDRSGLDRNVQGDRLPDADAFIVLPMIGADVEDALLDARCEATFRGQARTGRVKETRRREVSVLVLVDWT